MLHSVVLLVLWMLLFMASATVIGCTMAVRSVSRANRVVPGRKTGAPIGWLWSLRAPARLHRRLKRAVRLARASVAPLDPARRARHRPPDGAGLSHLADELGQRAGFIDDQLVSAAGARWLLPGLARQVGQVERDARRLAGVAATWRAQLQQAALSAEPAFALDMGSRLDAFEAAMAELSRVGPAR